MRRRSSPCLGAIGLQGVRLAEPTLGETVVVAGLGLVGLMTVQILRAHGCRVMGIDYNPRRLELAHKFGCYAVAPSPGDDIVMRAMEFSRGRGVDAVMITASTESSELVSEAARMCRRRGRIVLVGVAGLKLSRHDFYEKEITLQVSCSYGPGRYDPSYEQEGHDYPAGFVRWTEQRNFEAVLDLMASNALDVAPLITHRFSIEQAAAAYSVLTSDEPSLGILLEFPMAAPGMETDSHTVALDTDVLKNPALDNPVFNHPISFDQAAPPIVGCIGSGNFGGRVLIPALVSAGAELHTLVTANGLNAAHYGRKYGFRNASTSVAELLAAREVNTIFIATRHDSHARLASQALRCGRHVYVEKPLALHLDELAEVEAAYAECVALGAAPILQVGFNRRFSPHVRRMREMLSRVDGPKSLSLLVNAGAIPMDHWTQDPKVGGGRILGEACHFIDLARCLVGSPMVKASADAMRDRRGGAGIPDTAQIALEFADGSIASIQYYANGHRSFPKERVEVFASGRILQLENFRVLRGSGWSGFRGFRTWKQDKGHVDCVRAFLKAVGSGGPPPIPAAEIFEVSRVAIEVAEALGCR
jgi:predicted dehydrogenase